MAQESASDVPAEAELKQGTLFQGLKFWLSHKVPQRSRFINDIRANGGESLPIEKHADIKIVDHAKKGVLPGTYSYTFIESSVRNGVLEELENHKVGPPEGTVRSVGSIIQPPKGTRNKYTQDDDIILWNWVHRNPQRGGGTDGNEIYKQLEAQYPQHPWQSWRDRWIKQLKGKQRPFPLPHNGPPTPPSDVAPVPDAPPEPQVSERQQEESNRREHDFASFDEEDAEALMKNGADILEVQPQYMKETLQHWALHYDEDSAHTAEEWQNFWEQRVRPRFLKRMAKQAEGAPKGIQGLRGEDVKSPKKPKAAAVSPFSPSTKMGTNAKARSKSPSYHPESPKPQLADTSFSHQESVTNSNAISPETPGYSQGDSTLGKETVIENNEKLKRKRALPEEEIPSSSPPDEIVSTPKRKRIRHNSSGPTREIPSTPDATPVRKAIPRPDSPLFIESGDEEVEVEAEEPNIDNDIDVNESPLGKQPSESLSEPSGLFKDTQAILRDNTQKIDLTIPPLESDSDDTEIFLREPTQAIDSEVAPPDQGWNDEDSGADASSESELSAATQSYDPRPTRQQTQAILREETASPDFDIADPEGGWDPLIPSSPMLTSSSPSAESEASDVGAQTEAWINSHVAENIPIDHVISVLKSTSMDTDLADRVLKESTGEGRGLPSDIPGVWTTLDDEDLRATDARKIQRLELKHGMERLTARWEFLSFYGSI